MDRSDMLLVGLGGGGGNLFDTIIDTDQKFHGYFINTSITDIESLNNYNPVIKNGYCLSTGNGVGRKRNIAKELVKSSWLNLFDIMQRFNQKHIVLGASLGGGSGSSELSVILEGIDMNNSDPDSIPFDKNITLILILPSLNSPEEILQNAIDTWEEIRTRKCITNIIFVDNDSPIGQGLSEKQKEKAINEAFADVFDSIFDVTEDNGTNFDEGNLGNILTAKGCLYFYDITGYANIEDAMKHRQKHSPLAEMFIPENTLEILNDGSTAIKCGRYGISFSNPNYNRSYLYKNFKARYECYEGNNVYDRNMIIISGCYPPIDTLQLLEHELEERSAKNSENLFDFSLFEVSTKNRKTQKQQIQENKQPSDINTPKKKKKMKKNLFR